MEIVVLTFTLFSSAVAACYLGYYILVAARRPRVHGVRDGWFYQHLQAHCPVLWTRYWPTVWATNCHVNTIARSVLQRRPRVSYSRQLLSLPDGGVLALDWAEVDSSQDKPDIPVLLVMPGLTGCSSDNYAQWLVCDGLSEHFRPVVMNNRGNGGVALRTTRGYSAANTDDLECVLQCIRDRYPLARVTAVGVSLGGCILLQYLIKSGARSTLAAAMTIACPWDLNACADSLESSVVNRVLYNSYLTRQVKKIVRRNMKASPLNGQKLNDKFNAIMKCQTMRDFDAAVTAPMFGYSSVHEYYTDASSADRLGLIHIPLLSLSASDDPFVPYHSLPTKSVSSNPRTVLVVSRHGGHFGFLEGLLPHGSTWMNRVCRQFLSAVKHLPNSSD